MRGGGQRRAFIEAGGQVRFGTDVGSMRVDDTTAEYVALQQAGLSYPQILATSRSRASGMRCARGG